MPKVYTSYLTEYPLYLISTGIYGSDQPFGIDNKPPKGPANVSPMSQLYGLGGMLASGEREVQANRRRERNWDPYHTVVDTIHPCYERKTALAEPKSNPGNSSSRAQSPGPSSRASTPGVVGANGDPYSSRRSRSASPRDVNPVSDQLTYEGHGEERFKDERRQRSGSRDVEKRPSSSSHADMNGGQDNDLMTFEDVHLGGAKYRCEDETIDAEIVLLCGQYRLNASQRHAYQQFVKMLTEHDTTDQLRIVEDAFKEAQLDSLLCNFSGT